MTGPERLTVIVPLYNGDRFSAARDPSYVKLGLSGRHWLLQLARRDVNGLLDAVALTRLLANPGERWTVEALRLIRTAVGTRMPRLCAHRS